MIQSNNYQINEYKKIGFLQIIVMRLDVHRSSEEVMWERHGYPIIYLKPFWHLWFEQSRSDSLIVKHADRLSERLEWQAITRDIYWLKLSWSECQYITHLPANAKSCRDLSDDKWTAIENQTRSNHKHLWLLLNTCVKVVFSIKAVNWSRLGGIRPISWSRTEVWNAASVLPTVVVNWILDGVLSTVVVNCILDGVLSTVVVNCILDGVLRIYKYYFRYIYI